MSEFQKTMGRLQEMISRSNELVEIKKEAGKIAFQKGLEQGRVEGMKQELKDSLTTLKAIDNMLDCNQSAEGLKLLIKVKEKRLKELGGKE